MISVSDFMTKDLVTVRESDDLALAESLLRLGGIRHLPVVRERKLVGIVTEADFVRFAADVVRDLDLMADAVKARERTGDA